VDVPYRILVDSISLNQTLWQISTTADEATDGGGGRGGSGRGGGGRGGGGGGRGPGASGGGGPMGAGGGGGPMGAGGGGGPMGAGGGGGPMGAGGGRGPGGSGGTPPGGGGSGRGPSRSPSLEAMAPLPERPILFPPGTTLYDVPLTFEVEILDLKADPRTAGSSNAEGGGA